MIIGYQGEAFSYSDRASRELFPEDERIGFPSFVAAFEALASKEVDRLVVPIENSTTGSVLPVLDRLTTDASEVAVVSPDSDELSIFDVGDLTLVARHSTCASPRTAARWRGAW